MATSSSSRATTEREAAWNQYGDASVRYMRCKYDYENKDDENSTIIANSSPQLTENSVLCWKSPVPQMAEQFCAL